MKKKKTNPINMLTNIEKYYPACDWNVDIASGYAYSKHSNITVKLPDNVRW